MREIEAAAIEKTRLAKQRRATEKRKIRMAERRKGWAGVHKTQTAPDAAISESKLVTSDLIDDDIQPFVDIQLS